MTNKSYYALIHEYQDQGYVYDDFASFVYNNYPTVSMYMDTPNSLGQCPVTPEPRDMQIILREWQKTHAPINVRVNRVYAHGYSYIPEKFTMDMVKLRDQIRAKKAAIDAWWAAVDCGKEEYLADVIETNNVTLRNLQERYYALCEHYVER